MQLFSAVLLSSIVFTSSVVLAASPESSSRLDEMKRRVAELKIEGKHSDVKFAKEPLFRFSDPTRGVTDGTMWKLGETGRPKAILIMEHYVTSDVPWSYELTVASDEVPERIVSPGWVWKPDEMFHKWTTVKMAPKPHAEKFPRGRQVKQIIRKFRASEEWDGKTYELRLLPKAIAQYEDEEAGIIEGTIYVFAHGTNCELLMLLEAYRQKGQEPGWRAGFIRAGAAKFDVKYDGSAFWGCDFYDGRTRSHYMQNGLLDSPKSLVKK